MAVDGLSVLVGVFAFLRLPPLGFRVSSLLGAQELDDLHGAAHLLEPQPAAGACGGQGPLPGAERGVATGRQLPRASQISILPFHLNNLRHVAFSTPK